MNTQKMQKVTGKLGLLPEKVVYLPKNQRDMRKWMTLVRLLMLLQLPMAAADFETATEAVANMKVGWNLGNTLDANNSGLTGSETSQYETCWGQPVTPPELFKVLKDAGFNAMRIPVTWYQHLDSNDNIDEAWMARVEEVVNYVLAQGMYCIINVHHDTGTEGWLMATTTNFSTMNARFVKIWQQVAERFKNYDEHLLFESYNEMLDSYDSWCFASFATPSRYDATVAANAYKAINDYAQNFVNTVRATGGNNANRNLIVNTYAACCGEGSWNQHLTDPLKEMKLPDDQVENHLIFEVHSYPTVTNLTETRRSVDDIITKLKTHLVAKGAPVIFGEWGTSTEAAYTNYRNNMAEFAKFFVQKTKAAGIGTFYWMGLIDGMDRLKLKWSQPEIKNAILKGWYGDDYVIPANPMERELAYQATYTYQWSEMSLYSGDALKTSDYKGIRVVLAEKPENNTLSLKVYGATDGKEQYESMTEAEQTFTFNSTSLGNSIRRITLQYKLTGNYTIGIKDAYLIKADGTEVEGKIGNFHGCNIEVQITPTDINTVVRHDQTTESPLYNLKGQRVREPQGGIYIRKGKKYIYK